MTAVIQRALSASCKVDGNITGQIGHGLVILLGVKAGDTESDVYAMADKIIKLRIFSDENDKLNLSLHDVGGEMLVVSNFTLLADYAHGNRPSYIEAAKPDEAEKLYTLFSDYVRGNGFKVENGVFGADMKIELINDGPITIVMESEKLSKGNKGAK